MAYEGKYSYPISGESMASPTHDSDELEFTMENYDGPPGDAWYTTEERRLHIQDQIARSKPWRETLHGWVDVVIDGSIYIASVATTPYHLTILGSIVGVSAIQTAIDWYRNDEFKKGLLCRLLWHSTSNVSSFYLGRLFGPGLRVAIKNWTNWTEDSKIPNPLNNGGQSVGYAVSVVEDLSALSSPWSFMARGFSALYALQDAFPVVNTGIAWFRNTFWNTATPVQNGNVALQLNNDSRFVIPGYDAELLNQLNNTYASCKKEVVREAYKTIVKICLNDASYQARVNQPDCAEANILCAWVNKYEKEPCVRQTFYYKRNKMHDPVSESAHLASYQKTICRRIGLMFAALRAANVLDLYPDNNFIPVGTNVQLHLTWTPPVKLNMVYENHNKLKTTQVFDVKTIIPESKQVLNVKTQYDKLKAKIDEDIPHFRGKTLTWHVVNR